ncbi:MAG: L,D-transpeptidase [Candidatus Pacebacteria bacterium]|nr:L,D-transpeptidase [Candidatus Paceibacterota bacterium]
MPVIPNNYPTKKKKRVGFVPLFLFLLLFVFSTVSFFDIFALEAEMVTSQQIKASEQIEIVFNQRVISVEKENIVIIPEVDFSFVLSENRKSLSISADHGFVPEQKYEVILSGVRGMSGVVLDGKIFIFYTEEGVSGTLDVSGADYMGFSEMELSENRYIVPESSQVKEEIEIVPYITEGKYIDISISNQVMTIFEDGFKVNEFLISTGRYGMSTPLGEFSVKSKEVNHWSNRYKLWMPYSMNFYGPYFIHELPYWPNGYHEGEEHLGTKVSHGCIRLGIGPARYVFDWAEIGTPIYVH